MPGINIYTRTSKYISLARKAGMNVRCSGEREINPRKKIGDPAGTRTQDLPIGQWYMRERNYYRSRLGHLYSLFCYK